MLVAIFGVFVAPRLQARFGIAPTLYVNLTLFAVDIFVIALFASSQAVLIGAVIATGVFIGINNTITTQAVMTVSPAERSVSSSAYGFVRFIGGGLAPYFVGRMAEHWGVHVPFYVGAATVLTALAALSTGHRQLRAAEQKQAAELAGHEHDRDAVEIEALSEELGSAT